MFWSSPIGDPFLSAVKHPQDSRSSSSMPGEPPFNGVTQFSDLPKGMHGGVCRVVHHDGETMPGLHFPIGTESGYSVTEAALSDNAQEAPIFRGRPKKKQVAAHQRHWTRM